jgi:hypothetical protein
MRLNEGRTDQLPIEIVGTGREQAVVDQWIE